MKLLEPLALGPRTAPNRILFGPHVTNLGDDDRRFTDRHVAYYERRAPRRVRDDRRRRRQRPRLRLAVRTGPAGRRRRGRLGARSSPPADPTAPS